MWLNAVSPINLSNPRFLRNHYFFHMSINFTAPKASIWQKNCTDREDNIMSGETQWIRIV
jgi:hypothetical protein